MIKAVRVVQDEGSDLFVFGIEMGGLALAS